MKTHQNRNGFLSGLHVSMLLLMAIALFAPQMTQAGQGRRQGGDFSDANVTRDVVYRRVGGHDLKLDIYSPKSVSAALPAVIWIHGNRWSRGKKQAPPFDLMAHGYIVVSVEYRLSGEAPFPAQIEDCKAAVRWLRANATTYHIDPDHIGAWGHSAGGHLAALLGTTAGVTDFEGAGENSSFSSRIQAVCSMSGPSDLWALYGDLSDATEGSRARGESLEKLLGGKGEGLKVKAMAASPTTYITKDDAPILLLHGENDMSIPVRQSEVFASKLKAAGVDATLEVAKGRGHGVGGPQFASVITAFFDKHLKSNSSREVPSRSG